MRQLNIAPLSPSSLSPSTSSSALDTPLQSPNNNHAASSLQNPSKSFHNAPNDIGIHNFTISSSQSSANSSNSASLNNQEDNEVEESLNKSILSFVGWISSYLMYFCYIAWAVLPTSLLHSWGITYYPSRYYAIALPAYCITTYLLLCMAYIGWNMMNTHDPEDFATMRDIQTKEKTPLVPPNFIKSSRDDGIASIGDIDPIALSRVMNLKVRTHISYEQ